MNPLLREILHNKLLWLLVFVPALFAVHKFSPDAHTLLFALSVLANQLFFPTTGSVVSCRMTFASRCHPDLMTSQISTRNSAHFRTNQSYAPS